MREGSLFTGTNALGMAAHSVLGSHPVWFADNDPAVARLLVHHYPHVPNLGDVREIDWERGDLPAVDLLTGGFPCQDISNAGSRKGITGERSGVWGSFITAIRVLRPRLVLIENVGALTVRGLDLVLVCLADAGFDAEWTVVRASDVGAPHRRERIFIAAADARSQAGALRRGLQPDSSAEVGWRRPDHGDCAVDWGDYTKAISRWEKLLRRAAPAPTVPGLRSEAVLNPALEEWMMGLPAGYVTAVGGLTREDQMRLIGNAVVPQQAAVAFTHLLSLLEYRAVAA